MSLLSYAMLIACLNYISVPCLPNSLWSVRLLAHSLCFVRVFDNTFTVVTRQVTEMLEGNVIAAHRFIRVSA